MIKFGDIMTYEELDEDTVEITFKDGVYQRRKMLVMLAMLVMELKTDEDLTLSETLDIIKSMSNTDHMKGKRID